MKASSLTAALLLAAPLTAAPDNGVPPVHKGADLSVSKTRAVQAKGTQGTGTDVVLRAADGKQVERFGFDLHRADYMKAIGAGRTGLIVDPPPPVPVRVRDVDAIDLQYRLLRDLAKVRPLNAADMQGFGGAMPNGKGLQQHPGDDGPLGPPTRVRGVRAKDVEEYWELALDNVLDKLVDRLRAKGFEDQELVSTTQAALERLADLAGGSYSTDLSQLRDLLDEAWKEAQGSPGPNGKGATRFFLVEVERARMQRAKQLTERRFAEGEPIDIGFRLHVATRRARMARAIGATR